MRHNLINVNWNGPRRQENYTRPQVSLDIKYIFGCRKEKVDESIDECSRSEEKDYIDIIEETGINNEVISDDGNISNINVYDKEGHDICNNYGNLIKDNNHVNSNCDVESENITDNVQGHTYTLQHRINIKP